MARIEPAQLTLRDGGHAAYRTVEPADVAALDAYLDHIARTSEFSVVLPEERSSADKLARNIAEGLDEPGHYWMIAEIEPTRGTRRIIGELSFRAHPRQRMAHHGHFGISVHADWRGRGLGRAMITHLLAWARAHPTVEKVCLGVLAENTPAISLYKTLGFKEECRRDREFKFGPDRYIDDIQMSMWVKPPSDSAAAD